MKSIIIFTLLVAIGLAQRLSINDENCNKYTDKFGTANNDDGTGATKLAFTGDVAFVAGSSDVKVNLRYSDVDLFNDKTYFGLVKEDGKPEASTCLDLKLWKYTSNTYSDPEIVNDLPITPSNNFQNQWRYYSFTIPGAQLSKRLVQTSNANQFIYKGYYAIIYYAAGSDQVQYTFYFEFSVTIDRATGSSVDTAFKPLSHSSIAGCTTGQACVTKADTKLNWCSDTTCTTILTTAPDLHLNDQFVLQQIIETKGMETFYLTGTVVQYTGNGLDKRAKPINVINTTKGQVIIQLKAEIAWRQVKILVTSTLSTTQTGGRRLLVQTEYDPVSGTTEEITCIKAQGKETCASCEEECQANGFAREGCDACSFSQQIAFVFLALLLVFAV